MIKFRQRLHRYPLIIQIKNGLACVNSQLTAATGEISGSVDSVPALSIVYRQF